MKNKFEVRGDTTIIYIKRKNGDLYEVLIDTEDLEKIRSLKKNITIRDAGRSRMYADVEVTNKAAGKRRRIGVHRLLMGDPEGLVIDHINHNSLDNRKANLRAITNAENGQNRRGAHVDSKTGTRGVTFRKDRMKYQVQIGVNKVPHYLGLYETVEEATLVAERFRAKHMAYSTEARGEGIMDAS